MKKTTFFIVLIALLSMTTIPSNGQCKTSIIENSYFGLQSGMPVSIADFSSFGADKFRPGWGVGVFGGYRFTPVWSLEVTASWGQQFMAERDCCYERDYFLGTDGKRYKFIPEGLEGECYRDLMSRVFIQRYGVQANMNVLGFFDSTKGGRWRAEISPALYVAGTTTDIFRKADNSAFAENIGAWHLGLGANAQASYAVTDELAVGLYGGFTHFTGKPIDCLPLLHVTNCVIDAGVKFTVNFGGKKKASADRVAVQPTPVVEPGSLVVVQEPVVEVQPEPVVVEAEPQVEPSLEPEPVVETSSKYPVIYFSHSSFWIEPSERAKMKEIADIMKADKSIRIVIEAWGDQTGGEGPNARISLMRAERVKMVLGQWLIPADRIEVEGCGIKHDAPSDAEARVAIITEIE